MSSDLPVMVMMRLKEQCINYIAACNSREGAPQMLDDWICEFYAKSGWTTEDVSVDVILQVFLSILEQSTDWEYSTEQYDEESHQWFLQRWTVPHHRNIMLVARIDMLSRTWAAYQFPVPGMKHEEEVYLWRSEGAKLDPKTAAHYFNVPWLPYRV